MPLCLHTDVWDRTGMHTVADLLCMGCQQLGRKTTLGWMYLKAKERDQQYKEGGYVVFPTEQLANLW